FNEVLEALTGSFCGAPLPQLFFAWQQHASQRPLALLANWRATFTATGADGNVMVFRALVADHLDQAILLALGTFRGQKNGAVCIELCPTLLAQVTVRIGITGLLGDVLFAADHQEGTGRQQEGEKIDQSGRGQPHSKTWRSQPTPGQSRPAVGVRQGPPV